MKLRPRGIFSTRGFSMVELLVVVGVTIIVMGTMLAFNRGSQKIIVLTSEQNRFIGMLERARSLALQRYNVAPGVQTCGIKVVFSGSTVSIYARTRPTISKAIDCANQAVFSEVMIETQKLESEVRVVGNAQSVYFSSPYLDTIFNPTSTTPMIIELGINNSSERVRVEITANGSISQKLNTQTQSGGGFIGETSTLTGQ